MPEVFNFSNFASVIGMAICLITSILLWWYAGPRNFRHRLLSLYFLTLGYGLFIVFLLYSTLMQYSPWFHFYRTGNIMGLAIMPVSFIYFQSILKQRSPKTIDLLHFLPVLLFVVDYIPIYLLPAAEKAAMAKADILSPERGQRFLNGWITPHIPWVFIRTAQMAIYWILQVRMLFVATKMVGGKGIYQENRVIFRWLILMCVFQALYFVPYSLSILMGKNLYDFVTIHTTISAGTILLVLVLLFNPQILYGFKGAIINHPLNENFPAENTEQVEEAISKERKSSFTEYLTKEKMDLVISRIEEIFLKQKPYLKKGYSIQDLSIATGYPPYLLSPVINKVYKLRFPDFINQYRIKHACELIQSGSTNVLTLQALAEQCGFNNRNSFTLAFKKAAGITPSEYSKKFSNDPPPGQKQIVS